jgi:tetratricopeptide (TPR) repeat protein
MTDQRTRAIEFYNQAVGVTKTDPQGAYRLLSSAVMVDPDFGQGWFMLGNSNADLQLWWGAVAAYRRAVHLPDGDRAGDMTPEIRQKCYANLAHRLYHLGEIEQAERMNDEAMHLNQKEPFALVNASMLSSINGDHDAAMHFADQAWELDQSPIIGTAAGFAYLFGGQYARGLELFENRVGYKLREFESYPYPKWQGVRVPLLYVVSDQGLGDAISFVRFLPLVLEVVDAVLLRVPGELVRLLSLAFHDAIDAGRLTIEPLSVAFPLADAWTSLMSIPVALDLTDDQIREQEGIDIPRFDFPHTSGWKAAGCFSIGIAWAGAAVNDLDKFRSIPFTDFLTLYRVPGVQLYCLQVGERVQDLHHAGAAGAVRDLSPYIRDAADTASLMREMDLIICVDSFVGHLAGALNLECWTLLGVLGGDWRAGRAGEHPLWYPATTVFRQDDYGTTTWPPVWEAVIRALKERVTNGEKWKQDLSAGGDLGDRDERSGFCAGELQPAARHDGGHTGDP